MEKEEFNKLVQSARETDLLSYFRESGYQLDRKGDNYYVKEIPGLCIKPDKNQWYHHYTNVGRTNNSVDCLTLVLHKNFNQAVFELTGRDVTMSKSADFPKKQAPQYTSPPPSNYKSNEKKELQMPEHAPNMRNLFAYFCQTRKIPSRIVEELVHAGLLYQSQNTANVNINGVRQTFHNSNAVFVHKNDKGEIIGGEIQGCNSFKRFKGIAPGTGDSAFIFSPVPSKNGKPKRAYIFESAIDLMSFYTFCEDKRKIEGALFVSMAGLKPTVPKALEAQGIEIFSCVDNDEAGRRFEAENNFPRSQFVKDKLDRNGFKDWNELLVFKSDNPNANLLESSNSQQQNKNAFTNFISRSRR